MWFCLHSGGGRDSQGWSSSMTSSMQLAQECLKDPPEASEEPPAPLEGLEMFAQTIETGESMVHVTSGKVNMQTLTFLTLVMHTLNISGDLPTVRNQPEHTYN